MLPQNAKKSYSRWFTLGLCLSTVLPASYGYAVETTKVEKETSIHINQNVVVVSGRMSFGYLNGMSNENVYVPEIGHKLSELNWDIDNVYMMGLGASISPLSWLKFNADVWFKLNDGDGNMRDYDWFYIGEQYTLYSRSDNLDLTRGLKVDINSELTFYRYEKSRFYGILGFKWDSWKWQATGGVYNYYGVQGAFADVPGITYEQNFYAPYFGLGMSSTLSQTPITFSGRVFISPYVWGDDKDQHHMRNLVFEEDFDSGTMGGVEVKGAYSFTDHFSLALGYEYQKYNEMKAGTKVTDTRTGQVTRYGGDESGMDNYTSLLSLTAEVSF
jgi:plasminogen activator